MPVDVEYLQEQVYVLQNETNELRMEIVLLQQEINSIKNEGCWRFYENNEHEHK